MANILRNVVGDGKTQEETASESRYVDLKIDTAFKKMFIDPQMLLGLVNAIIKDYEITEIKKIEIPRSGEC